MPNFTGRLDHAWLNPYILSQTVKDLTIGSGLTFEERGTHAPKGVPGQWQIYELAGP